MTTTLDDVTIRLDAAYDLTAAGLPASEADEFAAAYRRAAAAICEGVADVRVVEVTGGSDVGCDAAWAQDYELWQTTHDCVRRADGRWTVSEVAVERARKALAVWASRNVAPPDAE